MNGFLLIDSTPPVVLQTIPGLGPEPITAETTIDHGVTVTTLLATCVGCEEGICTLAVEGSPEGNFLILRHERPGARRTCWVRVHVRMVDRHLREGIKVEEALAYLARGHAEAASLLVASGSGPV